MRLKEWVDKEAKVFDLPRLRILEVLADASLVSLMTIKNVDNGMRLGSYKRAKAVSDATKGQVTIPELCE